MHELRSYQWPVRSFSVPPALFQSTERRTRGLLPGTSCYIIRVKFNQIKTEGKLEVLRDSLGMKCFATAPARQQQASTFCTLGWLKGLGQWKDMKKFVGALDREASRSA